MTAWSKWRRRVWIPLACLATALLVWGGLRGEAGAVLVKAVNLCLECIGIG